MTDRVQEQLDYARRTGRCPICRKKMRAPWKDGSGIRVTCGRTECYLKWLFGNNQERIDSVMHRDTHEEEE